VVAGAHALTAMTAVVLHQDGHAITVRKTRRAPAQGGHFAGHLVTDDARQRGARKVALARHHVVVTDAAGAQPHQHLAVLRHGHRQFDGGELLGPAIGLKDDGLHGGFQVVHGWRSGNLCGIVRV
jgi:hypothetical protein